MIAQLQKIFDREPLYAPDEAKAKWKTEGPFTLEKFIREGKLTFDESYEIRDISDFYHGQVDAMGRACGIGRGQWLTGGLYEGEWGGNNRNGFGRDMWGDGTVYFGECKDGLVHGWGQKKTPAGTHGEGFW